MSNTEVSELSAESKKSFDDAIASGVARATKTVKDVQGAWVKSMKVDVANGKIVNYRVVMKVTFVLHD